MKQELQDFIIELYKRQFTVSQIKIIVEQKGAKNYSFENILGIIEKFQYDQQDRVVK